MTVSVPVRSDRLHQVLYQICSSRTIAKIKAQALNKVKLDALDKLKGGCLVVENAGLVKPDKLVEIVNLSAKDVKDFVIILTGEIDSISKLFGNTASILSEFEYLIDMTKISKEDMTKVALTYMENRGFKYIADVKNKLDSLIMAMETGNLDRLIKVVDTAIENASKRDKEKKKVIPEDFD